jgi:hypothetical protein
MATDYVRRAAIGLIVANPDLPVRLAGSLPLNAPDFGTGEQGCSYYPVTSIAAEASA